MELHTDSPHNCLWAQLSENISCHWPVSLNSPAAVLPNVHLHSSSQVPIKPPLLSMSHVRSTTLLKLYTNSQDLCCPWLLLLTLVPTTTCVSATRLCHYIGTSWWHAHTTSSSIQLLLALVCSLWT